MHAAARSEKRWKLRTAREDGDEKREGGKSSGQAAFG
jgi:hypothetical protein